MLPITNVPVTQVAKGIHRIGPLTTGHTSHPTSPYLIVGKTKAMVCEPGQDGQVPGIIEAIEKCELERDQVEYVWASHIHLYHVQGLSVLLKELPKAKFLVHPRGAPHVIDTGRLMEQTREIWDVESPDKPGVKRCYGPMQPVPANRVTTVEDNQIIDLGGKKVQIIFAPGHAPHHMALFDLETRALFPGDICMVPGPGKPRGGHDIRPPMFYLDQFLQTVQHYIDLKPSVLLTFGDRGGTVFNTEECLRWAIEDHLAIERMCRDGLQRKQSFHDIVRRVNEYMDAVGARPSRPRERDTPEFASGGLLGMLAHIRRKDPSLDLPPDITWKMRGEP